MLNLIVIRGSSLALMGRFYERLGCIFKLEQHGKGPEHLVWDAEGLVFEIYPRRAGGEHTIGVRLGFVVEERNR